jgi:hypothetical protein
LYSNYFIASVRYPDTYYLVQPVVKRICNEMDLSDFPSTEEVEVMVDMVYNEVVNIYPELTKEPEVQMKTRRVPPRKRGRHYQNNKHRRTLLRDLISILLINEILCRRRPCH